MGTLYELRDGRRNPSILADGPLLRQRGRTDRSRAEGLRARQGIERRAQP